jgi:hypothetical protein
MIATACSSGESSATTSVSVVAPSTEQWTDTPIDCGIDDAVLIEADGAVKPTRNPAIPLHDPNGDPEPTARQYNVEELEEANHAALIGRIGEAGAPFEVGSELLSEADTEARLFLGMNDQDVEDYEGEYTATVTETRRSQPSATARTLRSGPPNRRTQDVISAMQQPGRNVC